jgi:recombination associated protein RdgC
MFKSLIAYRISPLWPADLAAIEEALAKSPFIECGATQQKSAGWVPPRGEAHGALVESIGGQWIARLMTETKSVPGDVLARKVKEKAARIEQETGRKPGRKESKELKDEALLDLLPMAFTKQASTWVWVDPTERLLGLDTSSQGRADEVVSLLVDSLPGLSVSLINTQTSPQAAMAHWLATQEPPVGFSIDRECELKAADESKAVVKYGRHPLDIAEVQEHIKQGKLPTKLALTWDDRVSFVLTEGLQIKKLAFLDSVFEGTKADEGGFDTDVAIATGELRKLIPDLVEALGGESESGVAAALQAKGEAVVEAITSGTTSSWWGEGPDPLYDEAVKTVRAQNKASISLVQRVLRIGYNRAACLLEEMEKAGVVSAMSADGRRMVLS